MKITVDPPAALRRECGLLVSAVYQGEQGPEVDRAWKLIPQRLVAGALDSGDFGGKPGDKTLLYPAGARPAQRLLLIGLGKREEVSADHLRSFGGLAATCLRDGRARQAAVLLPSAGAVGGVSECTRWVCEGLGLGGYSFRRFKTGDGRAERGARSVRVVVPETSVREARREARERAHVGGGIDSCRDLGNLPANHLGPEELAEHAREQGRAHGLSVRVLTESALKREGMEALRAVAAGSKRPPRLIVMEYRPARRTRARPVVLVGKAITFDSGGISIKPAKGMEEMKYDMCGGAAVFGAMLAIGKLRPKRPVVGLLAAAENMPGGSALRPGDVIRSAAGLTIEIVNTDAEGRLVLADALHHAKGYKPALIVDLATLTGACVVALGSVHSGLFGKDPLLVARVGDAAARAGEKMWPMPLDDEYFDLIESSIADVKNSAGRAGGAVSAAAFLSKFVGDVPWVHIDIAGTAWREKKGPYQSAGATGHGVRTLVELCTDSMAGGGG